LQEFPVIGSKDLIAVPYNPKVKKEGGNNIYVKNFPETWTDEKLREVFS